MDCLKFHKYMHRFLLSHKSLCLHSISYITLHTVQFATDAVKLGVQGAFITDGRVPHALLNEILAGGEEGLGSGGGGTVVTL